MDIARNRCFFWGPFQRTAAYVIERTKGSSSFRSINDKLDPDGWLAAGHMFNCTEILEKQGAEKKNAQPTIEL